jgi:hypothetical protein
VIVNIRPWLELLYFLSGIVVAAAVVYGLQQIKLLKRDIRIRNERAAKENAVEYGARYLNNFTKLWGPFFDAHRAAGLSSYKGPIEDFSVGSLKQNENARKRYELFSWLGSFNELEAISSAFTSGVADEEIGFKIFGRSFCHTVRDDYDLIAISRQSPVRAQDYWSNIVELYTIWAPRLQQAELVGIRDMLNVQIAKTSGESARIRPIGTE